MYPPSSYHSYEEQETCPDCPYRILYEGREISLNEEVAARAALDARLGSLRKGILQLMRRYFPSQFLDAERHAGTQLASSEDDVLLAYLGTFVAGALGTGLTGEPIPGMTHLRQAVRAMGADIPASASLEDCASALDAQLARGRQSAVTKKLERAEPRPTQEPGAPHGTGSSNPNSDAQSGQVAEPARLVEKKSARGVTSADSTVADAADLLGVFEHTPWLSESPDSSGGSSDLADLFEDERSGDQETDSRPSGSTGPARRRHFSQPPEDGDREARVERGPLSPLNVPASDGETAVPDESRDSAQPASTPNTGKQGITTTPEAHQPTREVRTPLRPQLFPTGAGIAKTTRRAPAKRVRSRATSPEDAKTVSADPVVTPTNPEPTNDANADHHANELIEQAIREPKPVFISDLVKLVGSGEEVQEWEERRRSTPDDPVRFIGAKTRHRARGSLVLPYANDRQTPRQFADSLWGQLSSRYRGTRAYELGVILHRVGSEIVSSSVGNDVIVLRLNQPRGLVGMAISAGADLSDGSDARSELLGAVHELLGERLSSVVVLTLSADTLEPAVQAMERASVAERWNPSAPVVAATSWSYAMDQGASAQLVLGG